jgi:hemerythrin-like domain-containing protein
VLLEAAPGPDNPLGMLMACHRRLEAKLTTLKRVIEVYQQRDEERYDQAAGAIGMVIRHLHGPGRLHHEDEEISLFPRMIARDPAVEKRLARLEFEHEKLEVQWSALLPLLVRLSEGHELLDTELTTLAQGVAVLTEGYLTHIHEEDEQIYAEAKRLLSEEELALLGTEMAARRQVV